jgi:hypothetical protein
MRCQETLYYIPKEMQGERSDIEKLCRRICTGALG